MRAPADFAPVAPIVASGFVKPQPKVPAPLKRPPFKYDRPRLWRFFRLGDFGAGAGANRACWGFGDLTRTGLLHTSLHWILGDCFGFEDFLGDLGDFLGDFGMFCLNFVCFGKCCFLYFNAIRERTRVITKKTLPMSTTIPGDVDALRESLRAHARRSESSDWLRSLASNVHATIVHLSASTESQRQQLEQARCLMHAAVNDRVDALLASLATESTLRTSKLERQLVNVDNALETLQREQAAVCDALEASTDEQLCVVGHELTQRLDAVRQAVDLLPSQPVETDAVKVRADAAMIMNALCAWGAVNGVEAASDVFDRGFALLIGRGVKADAAAAFAMFEDAAAQGNTTAKGYAATQRYREWGVIVNPVLAAVMFDEAASCGDLYSRAMQIMIDNQRVSERKTAFTLLRHAASGGHVAAEHELGICYRDGVGCDVDKGAACKHFQQSAGWGYALAQFELACCYDDGNGVDKDPVQAAVWYNLAAEQGHACAQYNLGVCYDYGKGVVKDFKEAAMWYRHSANQGDADAQNSLGACYHCGDGVTKNLITAVMYYERAAAQGHAAAQYNMGYCCAWGEGVVKDFEKAAMWFTRAAEQGDADAQCELGTCYARGNGVKRDLTQAVAWYTRAADLGSTLAMQCLYDMPTH